jgi:hypothetical protein
LPALHRRQEGLLDPVGNKFHPTTPNLSLEGRKGAIKNKITTYIILINLPM